MRKKNLRIATILPYKENYTFSKAQAAAIWECDFFKYSKNKKGVLSQSIKDDTNLFHKKKLSPKAKDLLKKIQNNSPRYENIDRIIKKYSS